MTLTQKLMKIVETVNSDGGVAFLKIRLMLEDVQREIDKGNSQAIQFEKELDHVLGFCEMASKIPFDSGT
jgi:hypothetical protein